MDQIAEYENAAHDYVQDGVRLLELAKKAYFIFKQQKFKRKAEIAEFRVFELDMEGSNSHRNLRPTFDLLINTTWQRKKATGSSPSDPCPEWRRGQDSNLQSDC